MKNSDFIGNRQWQVGLMLFTRISSWLVGPIILGLIAGKYFDKRYQSSPRFFLIFTGLAFLITCFGIVKETRLYMEQIEKQARNNSKKDDSADSNADKSQTKDHDTSGQ